MLSRTGSSVCMGEIEVIPLFPHAFTEEYKRESKKKVVREGFAFADGHSGSGRNDREAGRCLCKVGKVL